jgi:gamma-glutamylcyclotransferase (GGCT)/AIG2-like uncharacterized protein YtfP
MKAERASGSADASSVLFVYGSLKRGQPNHAELRGARFLRAARTARAFALRELAGFPALVPGERAVSGELYAVASADLPLLDDFEGDAYLRGAVRLADGVTAIAYLARSPHAGAPWPRDEWPAPGESDE